MKKTSLLLGNKSVSSLTPPSLPQCRPGLTRITIVTVVLSRHINTGSQSASAQQEGLRVRLPHYPTFPPGLLSIFIIGKLKWEIFVSKIVHKNYLKDKIIYTSLVYSNFGLNSSLKVLNFFQGP